MEVGVEDFGGDLAFPAADGDGGDAVADEVGDGATFAHEAVDSDEEGEGFDGDAGDDGESGGEGDEAGAGDAAGAFGGDHGDEHEADLLREVEGGVGGLGEEDGGHGHVDVGAVEIEAVAGGYDESDGGGRAAEGAQLLDHERESGLGGAGAEDQEDFLFDVAEEAEDGEAAPAGDAAEDEDDEESGGDVEAEHEREEFLQGADAIAADGEGHGTESADGSGFDDDAHDAEEHSAGAVDDMEDGKAAFAEAGDSEGGDEGDEENLEEVATGEGADEAVGDDVEEEVNGAEGVGFAFEFVGGLDSGGAEVGDVDVEAGAGFEEVDNEEADGEGKGGDDFEVEERFAADAAEFFHVAHGSDAVDDGAEDDGGDHHLDEFDEAIAERFEGFGLIREEVAEGDADCDGDEDLDVEDAIPGGALGGVGHREM